MIQHTDVIVIVKSAKQKGTAEMSVKNVFTNSDLARAKDLIGAINHPDCPLAQIMRDVNLVALLARLEASEKPFTNIARIMEVVCVGDCGSTHSQTCTQLKADYQAWLKSKGEV